MIKKIVIILMILASFLFADDYRTIKRNTTITTNNGERHKVGDFGTYHALLIYVEDYKYLNNLSTPQKDIKSVAKILRDRYGFVKTKIVENPKNNDELIKVLDGFKNRLNEDDNLLIYYAGHGSKGGYWQLSFAEKHSRSGWISIREAINKTLNGMRSKHILVVADSCYSGELTRSGIEDYMLNPENREYYSKLYGIKSRNVLTSGGFAPVLDKDPTNPNHSIFANGLLQMLEQNHRVVFSLEEKYKKVEEYVSENSNKKQIPLYSDVADTGHIKGGDFIFVDKKSIAQKREKEKNKLYSLTITRTPSDATVQILDIKPRYKDGIMLERGEHRIRVFLEGYKEKRFSIDLEDTLDYEVELESDGSVKVEEEKEKEVSEDLDVDSEVVEAKGVWENIKYYFKKLMYLIGVLLIILGFLSLFSEDTNFMSKISIGFVISSFGFLILSFFEGGVFKVLTVMVISIIVFIFS